MTLLSGSLIFYAYGELKFLPLLLLSIVMNYFFGLHLGRREQYRTEQANAETGIESRLRTNKVKAKLNKRRRIVFLVAIAYNVGMLAAFKYVRGGAYLPLGISFYTFQMLSYLIDVYRGSDKMAARHTQLSFAPYPAGAKAITGFCSGYYSYILFFLSTQRQSKPMLWQWNGGIHYIIYLCYASAVFLKAV